MNCYFEKEKCGVYSYAWASVETKERVGILLNLMEVSLEELPVQRIPERMGILHREARDNAAE